MTDWTIFKILSWTESYFKKHLIESPRLTCEILLGFCLGIKRLDLYLQHDRPLQKDELARFKNLIKRRIKREPLAYITGKKGFWESEFFVGKGVLIPRQDTETLVSEAIKQLAPAGKSGNEPKKVLELGTGSGAVIVSLAKTFPEHLYFANDVSGRALDMALKNVRKIVPGRISFFSGSWFSSFRKGPFFDLIVSNPPYIPTLDIQTLEPEIRNFEPIGAIDGGEDGLDCIRHILTHSHEYLVSGGKLLLEIGYGQEEDVNIIAKHCPVYGSAGFVKDLAGRNRAVLIKKLID